MSRYRTLRQYANRHDNPDYNIRRATVYVLRNQPYEPLEEIDPTVDNRDEIFAILDSYIAAGWGEVPRVLIEKLEAKNGGVLPDEPPTGYRQGRKPKGFSETMRERMTQQ